MSAATRWLLSVRGTARMWRLLLVALDSAVIAISTLLAYYIRFEGPTPPVFESRIPAAILVSVVVYVGLLALFRLYRLVLRYVGTDTFLRVGAAVFLGFALLVVVDLVLPMSEGMRVVPIGVLAIQALLVLVGVAGVRMIVRTALYLRGLQSSTGRRVLIVGAGSAGSLLVQEIQNRPELGMSVVGLLDDDERLHGRTVRGVPVIGKTSGLRHLAERRGVVEILVAIPSAPTDVVRRILNEAADAGLSTEIMPTLVKEKGSVSLSDLRKVEVEDLLGRDPTPIDVDRIAETIAGKVIAVTGAAGSIGSELCRQILTLKPARLLLLDIDETRLYETWLELSRLGGDVTRMQLCDIRDSAVLDVVFGAEKPQVVMHAAAYKHVPVMELSPAEAVKANVLGTKLVIEACERHGCERFVLISTDKAVAPTNVMGLTKSLAERVMLDHAGRPGVVSVAVRFGNVLGSRGSVIPIFEEQLRRGGPLTVTDPEVTRYFMTIPEAARLVLQAQAIGRSGDIFVLEMGEPVRIVDLARKMSALCGVPAEIEFVGLRPGEKLHESLVHEHERLVPTGREKILRVESDFASSPASEGEVSALIEAALAGRPGRLDAAFAAIDPGFASRHAASH